MHVGVRTQDDVDAVDVDELSAQVVDKDHRRRWYGAPLQPRMSEQDASRDPNNDMSSMHTTMLGDRG